MEIYLIKYYGRRDLGEGTLVNLTDGGDGAINLSAEARAKMSASAKGRIYSVERRVKISENTKGANNPSSKLTEAKVIEILRELRDNPYFGQLRDLSKKYGIKTATISHIKLNRLWTYICRETLTILN